MVNTLNALKPPIKQRASLIKPDNAGRPNPAKNASTIKPLKTGNLAAIPPNANLPANSGSL